MFRLYAVPCYYFSLLLFGVGGLLLSLLGLLLAWLPDTPPVVRGFQRLIHHHFRVFIWWGRFSRLMPVRFVDFPRQARGACIVVANHPALVDATFLLARLPEALCIFKPAISRNPVLGAAARRAGYLANDGGPDLVRHAAAAVAAGNTLVVFPEGTRTPPGSPVQPFKSGFVLIARRAGAPIQLVRIETNSNVLAKGRPWWRPPILPARFTLTLGPLVSAGGDMPVQEIAARIHRWFADPACHDALDGLTLPAPPPPAA